MPIRPSETRGFRHVRFAGFRVWSLESMVLVITSALAVCCDGPRRRHFDILRFTLIGLL